MSCVFDRGKLVIPLSEVERAEKTDSGRLRVHMKSGDYVMVDPVDVPVFVEMLKNYHDTKEGQ